MYVVVIEMYVFRMSFISVVLYFLELTLLMFCVESVVVLAHNFVLTVLLF